MDSTSYQAIEKNAPLLGEIDPHEPTKARNRRIFFHKGVAMVALLFLFWWSYNSAPVLYQVLKSETAKHAEHALTNDGYGLDDFDTVGSSHPIT